MSARDRTRWRSALALVLSALGVAGCAATPAPAPPAPLLDLPADWQADVDRTAAVQPPSPDAWWLDFDDRGLTALVTEVLAGSFDLAAAGARLDGALAAARAAGAALAPEATFGLDGSRRKQVFIGLPIPGTGGRALANTSTSIGAALNLSWEVDVWGRARSTGAAARAAALAAAADLDALRLSLAGQTAKAWFAAHEAELQLRLAAEVLENRRITAEQVRRRYLGGLRPALDYRLARSEAAAAEATLAARRSVRDTTLRQLRLLASRYPHAEELEEAALPALPPPIPIGAPADLVARRPDIVALERRADASGYRLAAARAALLPGLRLTGSAGRLGQELGDLLDSDLSAWSLAAGLLQPVFQGGRLRAGVQGAEAEVEAAVLTYAQALVLAFREVEEALAGESALGAQVEAIATAAREADAASALAGERYSSGLGEYLTVLEAQRRAAETHSRLLELERQRLANRVDLYLALGGGWSDTDRPAVARSDRHGALAP